MREAFKATRDELASKREFGSDAVTPNRATAPQGSNVPNMPIAWDLQQLRQ
jgi:hypothetical protein